jgi:tRNA pseudouridine55 synthase
MVNFAQGEVILINKEKSWTSFDVIRKLQSTFKYRKFGHAGTLDPLASGLLIICSGKKTKEIEQYQSNTKTYIADICLGAVTESFDAAFQPAHLCDASNISQQEIETILPNFLGTILQTPPIHSAIKINGRRAYDLARKGIEIPMKSREVTIHSLRILSFNPDYSVNILNSSYNFPMAQLEVVCSKGTYIRSLASDIGKALGVGGFLSDLIRTKIGELNLSEAVNVNDFITKTTENKWSTELPN